MRSGCCAVEVFARPFAANRTVASPRANVPFPGSTRIEYGQEPASGHVVSIENCDRKMNRL